MGMEEEGSVDEGGREEWRRYGTLRYVCLREKETEREMADRI